MKALILALAAGLLLPLPLPAADTATTFALDAARELRERARFPEWSQPVAIGETDPLTSQRVPTRQAQAGPRGAAPTLTVWASTIALQAGESVDLHAQLSALAPDTERLTDVLRAQREVLSATVTATLVGDVGGRLAELAYADDGRGADARAGDGIYSARYTLPSARAPAAGRAESVLVKVVALLPSGDSRVAVGGFQLSNPGARLTGRYRESLRDGNLVLAAEAEVLAPGRYHLTGTLADALGTPLASAQAAHFLAPGTHWLELSYYGLIFHERAASGRLRLASVALTAANGMPNALGPVLRDAYLTQALNLAALTRLPFASPDLLEAARRLEAGVKPSLATP